ncbi:MAG TPA: UV DNA damage repair endonuclease UvsE [Candidatus Pacearchaeota archaeon]|nr:UV DNA damage repair endonuclease UvsE [Candidatus Pacearchaeota archaeon]
MKIGYPCINNTLKCTTNSTFRLASYSEENLKLKIENNLKCLKKVLEFNKENNIEFFRISSDLIPFASHEINQFNWQEHFKKELQEIGDFIKENNFRISMHPDQFVLINSPNKEIVKRSIDELNYHCEVLEAMHLDNSAKVQIHVGGIYNNKPEAMQRFIENYNKLPEKIKKRLCIENDDRLFSLKDCLQIHKTTQIPIIFDFFHHECLNNKEPTSEAVKLASQTWKKQDGILMADYSSQEKDERKGKHAETIDLKDFQEKINQAKQNKNLDFDVMLEIKDKEKSAIKVIKELINH